MRKAVIILALIAIAGAASAQDLIITEMMYRAPTAGVTGSSCTTAATLRSI